VDPHGTLAKAYNECTKGCHDLACYENYSLTEKRRVICRMRQVQRGKEKFRKCLNKNGVKNIEALLQEGCQKGSWKVERNMTK